MLIETVSKESAVSVRIASELSHVCFSEICRISTKLMLRWRGPKGDGRLRPRGRRSRPQKQTILRVAELNDDPGVKATQSILRTVS